MRKIGDIVKNLIDHRRRYKNAYFCFFACLFLNQLKDEVKNLRIPLTIFICKKLDGVTLKARYFATVLFAKFLFNNEQIITKKRQRKRKLRHFISYIPFTTVPNFSISAFLQKFKFRSLRRKARKNDLNLILLNKINKIYFLMK